MSTPTTREWLREAARRITRGTPILAGQLLKRGTAVTTKRARTTRKNVSGWLGESTGLLDTLLRWVLLAIAAWVLWIVGRGVLGLGVHVAAGARGALWPASAVWLVAAYRAGRPDDPQPAPKEAEPDSPPPASAEAEVPWVPKLVFLAILHAEVGEARAVHLAHVAGVLAKHYPEHEWDVPSVAALCAAQNIPVEPKVRAHGKGATRGVLRSSLPPLGPVSIAPSVDVDVAGQESSTGASTSTSTGSSTGPEWGGGEGFVTVPDEVNRHRTHVHWRETV